jgi:enoyl-CoA hydratase
VSVPGPAGLRLALDGDVLRATIDRPSTRNAIDLSVIEGLERMVAAAHEQRVKVVVLRGAGGTFCSGADLREVRRLLDDPSGLRSFMARFGAALEELERSPWANVAVVEGYALAGGCELLLACDVVVAGTEARIGDRHAEHGLAPAGGGSVRLPEALPPALARYLLLSGEMLSGAEAAAAGLVTSAVEPSLLETEVDRIVARLRGRGRVTLATIKTMLADDGAAEERHARLERELDLFLAHARSADARAGLDSFLDG